MCKKSLLSLMLLCFAFFGLARAQSELTVYEDGTDKNSNVPFYGLYADTQGAASECVIPSDLLGEMAGGQITAMKFYIGTSAAAAWTGTHQVYLGEVDETTLTGITGPSAFTVVKTASFDATGTELTVEFDEPYTYGGGNLLIGTYVSVAGNWKSAYFYGVNQEENTGWYRNSGSASGSGVKFLPKTTFTYEAASTGCDMPTSIAVSNITPNGAQVTWEGDGTAWNLRYKASTDADYTLVEGLTTMSYTLSSLTENTAYSVGVQTVCSGSTSSFRSTSFTTANPCAAPTNLQVSDITPSSATLTWTAGYQETRWTVKYKKSTDETWTEEIVTGTPTLSLTGLEGLTTYNVQVYNCESYVSGSFTTAASFPYAQDFSASGIPTGWTQYTGLLEEVMAGTATLTSTSYGWSNGTDHSVLDGNHLYSNIYGTSCKKWIVTPAIPMESGARLTFDVAYTCYSSSGTDPQTGGTDDKFVVLASTDNMATWTILRQWDNAGSEYVLNDLTPATLSLNFDMADYAGTNLNIAFYAESTESNADNNIHVDNVVFELVPDCEKPTNLAVNYEGGTSATFTWTENGTATSWDLQYSTDAEFTTYTQQQVDGTPTYELTGLELATTYYVRVNAFCGAPSDYSNIVSFSTDICLPENQCELTFVLTDSYGDSWNGCAIQVVDVATGIVVATMANQNLDGQTQIAETQTVTLAVCDGREIQFVWVMGSYPGEASWVILDVNGEEITSGAGSTSMATGDVLATYTVNCTVTNCRRPTDLTVSEVGPHTAVLDWTENGAADAWVVEYTDVTGGGAVYTYDNVTKPYTMVGLFAETEYSVRVRPICSDFDDKWSKSVTFNTPVACPAPTDLEANNVTALSALISWNGFGESYDLRYMAIEDEGPIGGGGFEEKAFTGNHNPDLKLMANPDARPNVNTRANGLRDGWYHYDNGEFSDGIGTGGSNVYWAIMLPAGMTSETSLTKVALYENSSQNADSTITLFVYAGGTDAPGTLLYTEEIEPEAADAFHEITLANPVEVDPLQNLWIVFKQYGAYPAQGCVNTGDANGRWISLDGETWADVAGYGLDYTWMIRAYLEGEAVIPWIDVTGINGNEYEMTDLDPETTYVVQVRANCGDDGYGEWTSSIEFTTGSLCDAPYDLTASDITFTSVTLDWVNALESFNLKYRPIVHGEVLAEQNFDEGMGEWTTIDADEDGYDWVLGSQCGGVYLAAGSSLTGHNSADMIVSGSYSNVSGVGALTPDNYLVSPQITLGGTISFWACAQDASYAAEHFGVAVSTTVNDTAAAFTTIWETTMTAKGTGAKMNPGTTRSGNRAQGTWYQFTVDLSAYVGQTGYVAIRHFDCTDWFMLDVDDIVIEGYVETPEWVEINETAKPVVLTDLTYDTEYEWQVQGINPSCGEDGTTEWSEMATFFFPMPTQTVALAAGANYVSFYLDVTLNDLKAALLATGNTDITIKSKTQNTYYQGGRWKGSLTWDVAKMYIIQVGEACEITFEGTPLDPSAHPITIVNGANYIGFPLTESMSLTDAFAGFAVNDDVIQSKTGSAQYKRGRWQGSSLTTLEPGKGYIYKSSQTGDRILVFPSNAK